MANTYQSFYQNEKRSLQLEIDDNDGTDFVPSGAFYQVLNAAGNVIIAAETAAMVLNNTISIEIDDTITQTVGAYKIIWKIKQSGHTYKHVTELEVQQP